MEERNEGEICRLCREDEIESRNNFRKVGMGAEVREDCDPCTCVTGTSIEL